MEISGVPLIRRVIDAARDSGAFHYLLVSSDDNAVLDVAKAAGVEIYARSPELCEDLEDPEAGGRQLIEMNRQHVEYFASRYPFYRFDPGDIALTRIMGNSLVLDPSIFSRAVDAAMARTDWRHVHTVCRVEHEHHPDVVMEITNGHAVAVHGFDRMKIPSDNLRPLYACNGGPDICSVPDRVDGYVLPVVVPRTSLVHIHTDEDLYIARALWRHRSIPTDYGQYSVAG